MVNEANPNLNTLPLDDPRWRTIEYLHGILRKRKRVGDVYLAAQDLRTLLLKRVRSKRRRIWPKAGEPAQELLQHSFWKDYVLEPTTARALNLDKWSLDISPLSNTGEPWRVLRNSVFYAWWPDFEAALKDPAEGLLIATEAAGDSAIFQAPTEGKLAAIEAAAADRAAFQAPEEAANETPVRYIKSKVWIVETVWRLNKAGEIPDKISKTELAKKLVTIADAARIAKVPIRPLKVDYIRSHLKEWLGCWPIPRNWSASIAGWSGYRRPTTQTRQSRCAGHQGFHLNPLDGQQGSRSRAGGIA